MAKLHRTSCMYGVVASPRYDILLLQSLIELPPQVDRAISVLVGAVMISAIASTVSA